MSVLALLKAESSMQSTEVHLHYFFRTEIVSPNLTCWLQGSKLIAVVVNGFMIMMIHVCQGLTQEKLCTFLLLKNQKDVL